MFVLQPVTLLNQSTMDPSLKQMSNNNNIATEYTMGLWFSMVIIYVYAMYIFKKIIINVPILYLFTTKS